LKSTPPLQSRGRFAAQSTARQFRGQPTLGNFSQSFYFAQTFTNQHIMKIAPLSGRASFQSATPCRTSGGFTSKQIAQVVL
jgi:hypothetical protein